MPWQAYAQCACWLIHTDFLKATAMSRRFDILPIVKTSADMMLYFFQALDLNLSYPVFNPTYQIKNEKLDFILPTDAGDALTEVIDSWNPSAVHAADSIADFNTYRNSLIRSSEHSRVITFSRYLSASMWVEYRTMNDIAVAILVLAANAGWLDEVLARWVLAHKSALCNSGGFTLIRIKVIGTASEVGDQEPTSPHKGLLEIVKSNKSNTFKQYLVSESLYQLDHLQANH